MDILKKERSENISMEEVIRGLSKDNLNLRAFNLGVTQLHQICLIIEMGLVNSYSKLKLPL